MATVAILPLQSATAAGPNPIAVTPFAGFNATLTRAPYVTDLTQTGADVNWATTVSPVTNPGTLQWGPLGSCTAHTTTVPATLPNSFPAAGTPTSITGSAFSVVSGTNEYQSTVVLTGLSPSTTYCYRPLGPGSVDLLGSNPTQQFTTLDPANSSTPLTFDVVGDIGETLYSSTTAFPNNLNTDQAAVDSLIGSSGAKFVVTAGDVGYSGGTQANYGDLQNGGSEISDIFGPSYWAQTQGLPVFPGEGNHGQNTIGLRSWPEANTAAASGGAYAYDSYPAPTQDGTNAGTYPDGWYAFSDAGVRIYVLDSAWADGSNVGTATGAACTSAGEAACPGYQVDHDEHWTPSSPEYKWLAADLASHPGSVKLAVWHYPLRSDESSQDSDVYLQNSPSNPFQSTSLESLLSSNGVKLAFNGHAHNYERIAPSAAGQITNYVTGGGGGVLEPVSTGSSCTGFKSSGSIYAIGWSPTSNTGTVCGTGVPTPQSAAQVFNFLKVTVNGGTVTVTPTNAAGQTFDVQSYSFSTTPATVIDTPPPTLTNSTSASVTFHSTGSGATFTCSLDHATPSACTSPVSYASLAQGAHTLTVAASGGATPATANWTVETSPPTVPTILTGSAASATQVNLTWSTSTDPIGVSGYDVYRNGVLLTPSPVTTTSYTDSAASPGTPYQYTVDARDGAGNVSNQSTAFPVTTPAGSSAGPALVQTAGSAIATVSLPVPSTPGDLLVLSAGVFTGASHPITAVSDGKNTWTKVGSYDVAGSNSDGEMWYSANAASVSSVTVTTGASTVALRLQEFNGVAATTPLEGSNGAAGDSTASNSGTATALSPNDLAVGFVAGHSTSQAISITSPGYTTQPLEVATSPSTVTVESAYQDLSAPGSQSLAGSFGSTMYWASGIALFKAGTPPPPPGDFTVGDTPTSQTVTAGASASSTIGTTAVGTPQLVAFGATGLPANSSVSFTPQSITSGGSTAMSITTSTATPPGTYTVTVTATGTSAAHSTTFALTVATPPAITSATSTTFTAGTLGTFSVTTTGSPTTALSESGALPSGVTFADNGNGTATLAGTASGVSSSVITITASNGVGSPATQTFTLNVIAPPSDFSIGVSPNTATVTAGTAATTTVSTAVTSGVAQSVALSETGAPAGALTSFSPPSVTSGGGSTFSVTPALTTTPGTYTVTLTGTGSAAGFPTHSTTFSLTVNTPPAITSATSTTFTQGVSGTFTVTATGSPTLVLSESGALPTGVTFTDNGNGSATLAGKPASGSNASYPITLGASNGFGSPASQSFTLSVNAAPPPPDFTIAATPNSATVTAGGTATSTIGTTASGGSQSVALSATGIPSGASIGFSPQIITSGGSSTMSVITSSTTTPGPYSITVTGTGNATGGPVHSTTFSLTVTAPSTTTPRLVQAGSGTESASSTSLAGSFPTATTAGDLLVLSASQYTGATNHITSVTDTGGNTWTKIGSGYEVSGHNSDGEMWYSPNAKSTTTVTVHTASAATISFEVQEFAGVAAASPLDVDTGTANTGTAASSGSVTSTVANELVVGFVAGHNNAQAISVSSPGYTTQAEQTSTGTVATVITGYQVLAGPGPQSFAGSFGTAMYWAAGIAVFKPGP
ncbi:MAG TPA: fibronectin type III domain-containing protein [Acidimicrobiales bacterium]